VAKVLQLLTVNVCELFDRVDVERTQLGAARLGNERSVRQRRAALGLLVVLLELQILPPKRSA